MRVAAFTFSLSHFALIANVNEKNKNNNNNKQQWAQLLLQQSRKLAWFAIFSLDLLITGSMDSKW